MSAGLAMRDSPSERHRVQVWFGDHLMFAYAADPLAAERYARTVARHFTGLVVTIDQAETTGLRPLPGEILWTVAP